MARRIEYCPDHDSVRWQDGNYCLRQLVSDSQYASPCDFVEAVATDRPVQETGQQPPGVHDDEHRTLTRQFCQRCRRVSAVDFYSPMWKVVAGPHWRDSILCVACFAALGDEKFISWEEGIEFDPVSFRTYLASVRRVVTLEEVGGDS